MGRARGRCLLWLRQRLHPDPREDVLRMGRPGHRRAHERRGHVCRVYGRRGQRDAQHETGLEPRHARVRGQCGRGAACRVGRDGRPDGCQCEVQQLLQVDLGFVKRVAERVEAWRFVGLEGP